jgi:hypothetical protein
MKKTLIALALGAGLASAALATPVQWTSAMGGNDHWYEYVSTPLTWQASATAAAASNYSGMQGYLATLTSSAENLFASALAMSPTGGLVTAWFGLTDEKDEGIFRWIDGPEAGQTAVFTSWTERHRRPRLPRLCARLPGGVQRRPHPRAHDPGPGAASPAGCRLRQPPPRLNCRHGQNTGRLRAPFFHVCVGLR